MTYKIIRSTSQLRRGKLRNVHEILARGLSWPEAKAESERLAREQRAKLARMQKMSDPVFYPELETDQRELAI